MNIKTIYNYFNCVPIIITQAREKEERYLRRQQRRAELEQKRKEREQEKARLKAEKQRQRAAMKESEKAHEEELKKEMEAVEQAADKERGDKSLQDSKDSISEEKKEELQEEKEVYEEVAKNDKESKLILLLLYCLACVLPDFVSQVDIIKGTSDDFLLIQCVIYSKSMACLDVKVTSHIRHHVIFCNICS